MQLNRKKEAADLHGTDVKLLEFICSQSVKLRFFHILFVIIQKQYDKWQVGIGEPRGFIFVWYVFLAGDLKNTAEANLYSLLHDWLTPKDRYDPGPSLP